MNCPAEILMEVASYLRAADLKNFRLVHSRCASAGISFIPQNGLSVVGTIGCLKEMNSFLRCPSIANNTRKITYLCGEWPVCLSRRRWALHPLLFSGNDRSNAAGIHQGDLAAAQEAFDAYTQFIKTEISRKHYPRVREVFEMLSLSPSLQCIEIVSTETCAWASSMEPQFHALQKKIWMGPRIDYDVTVGLQEIILAFDPIFSNINTLKVDGLFNPTLLNISPSSSKFHGIRVLQIKSFGKRHQDESIQRFLESFPNLTELSLNFRGLESMLLEILAKVHWKKLNVLHVKEVWPTEGEIMSIISNHVDSLSVFTIDIVAFQRASWKSLGRRLRLSNVKAKVFIGGEICEAEDCNQLETSGTQP